MKRLLSFAAAFIAALTTVACSVPTRSTSTRSNGLGSAFTSEVSMTVGRLNAEGTLKRFGEGMWEIQFSSPNTLSGVKLSFSEGNTEASYKGLSFSVPQSALPVRAMMLNLINAVDTNARLDELEGEEDGNMLEVKGKLDAGEYVLLVDSDGRLAGFSMPNNSLEMTFTEVTLIGSCPPEVSSGTEAPAA